MTIIVMFCHQSQFARDIAASESNRVFIITRRDVKRQAKGENRPRQNGSHLFHACFMHAFFVLAFVRSFF